MKSNKGVPPVVTSSLATKYGKFHVKAYPYLNLDMPNLALMASDIRFNGTVDLRIHSECMTGDVFSSNQCDCGEQLDYSMRWIQKHSGLIIYLRQEGRGIGLVNKLKAYNLQESGLDTREANIELGFHEDPRDYTAAIEILNDLQIKKVRLLTNNPSKVSAFNESGIEVLERIPIEISPKEENRKYLKTKKYQMGHLFTSNHI